MEQLLHQPFQNHQKSDFCRSSIRNERKSVKRALARFMACFDVVVIRVKQMTLGEAAKAAGKSKSTIFRAVKSGKLSATRDGGEYRIDPAELFRAFPADAHDAMQWNDTQPTSAMPEAVGETAKDVKIRMLRELLQAKDAQIETLQQSLRLIEKMVPDQPAPTPQARSFWARLTGR